MSTSLIAALFIIGAILVAGVLWYFLRDSTVWLVARVSPHEQTAVGRPQVLILGDSTGYGTGASDGEYSIAGRIGNTYDVSINNQSVNGRTIGELEQDKESILGRYEVILLQIGANDILQRRSVAEVEVELRRLVSYLTRKTDHLLMMSSGNVGGAIAFSDTEATEYETLSRQYRAMFMRVATEKELTYVDLFEEPENDVFVAQPDLYFAADGLHPSDAGYAVWFSKLQTILHPILKNYEVAFSNIRN